MARFFVAFVVWVLLPNSGRTQVLDLGTRLGWHIGVVNLAPNLDRYIQPFADFYNLRLVTEEVEFYNQEDAYKNVTIGGYFRYTARNHFFIAGDIFVQSLNGKAKFALESRDIFSDEPLIGEFDLNLFSTNFSIKAGSTLGKVRLIMPLVSVGLTLSRNFSFREFQDVNNNPFIIGLNNLNSLKNEILSYNIGIGYKSHGMSILIDWQQSIGGIDVNSSDPLYKAFIILSVTSRIRLYEINLVSPKNRKLLKRIRQRF